MMASWFDWCSLFVEINLLGWFREKVANSTISRFVIFARKLHAVWGCQSYNERFLLSPLKKEPES